MSTSASRKSLKAFVFVLVSCALVVMLCLCTAGTAVAGSPAFDTIKLKEGELPGYRLEKVGQGHEWWVVRKLARTDPNDPSETDLEHHLPREQYPSLAQWWYEQTDAGTPAKNWDYLAIEYGIFDSPSQALTAVKAYHIGIADATFPTAVTIGDYSLRTIKSVTFARSNVVIHVKFGGSMRIDSSAFADLANLLIGRIDGNPPPVAITPQTLINDLHILQYMGQIKVGSGIVNSLQVKVEAAMAALARGDKTGAANALKIFVNDLNAFVREVAAQTGKAIEPAAAHALIAEANALIAAQQ